MSLNKKPKIQLLPIKSAFFRYTQKIPRWKTATKFQEVKKKGYDYNFLLFFFSTRMFYQNRSTLY